MPTLSGARIQNITRVSAQLTASTDSVEWTNTLYWVVTTDPTVPTAERIIAGQDSNGNPATASGNTPMTEVGEQPWQTATGLSQNVQYYAYLVQYQVHPPPALSTVPDLTVLKQSLPRSYDMKIYETSGTPGITYRVWRENQSAFDDCPDGIWTISSAVGAGNYRLYLEATNEFGVAQSNVFDLAVSPQIYYDWRELESTPLNYGRTGQAIGVQHTGKHAQVGSNNIIIEGARYESNSWHQEGVSCGLMMNREGTQVLDYTDNLGHSRWERTNMLAPVNGSGIGPSGNAPWVIQNSSAAGDKALFQYTAQPTSDHPVYWSVCVQAHSSSYIKVTAGAGLKQKLTGWVNIKLSNGQVSSSSGHADFKWLSTVPVGAGFYEITFQAQADSALNEVIGVAVAPSNTDASGAFVTATDQAQVVIDYIYSSYHHYLQYMRADAASVTIGGSRQHREFHSFEGSVLPEFLPNNFCVQVVFRLKAPFSAMPDGSFFYEFFSPGPGPDNHRITKSGTDLVLLKYITNPVGSEVQLFPVTIPIPGGDIPAGTIVDMRIMKRDFENELGDGLQFWVRYGEESLYGKAAVDASGESDGSTGQLANGIAYACDFSAQGYINQVPVDCLILRIVPNRLNESEILGWEMITHPEPRVIVQPTDQTVG